MTYNQTRDSNLDRVLEYTVTQRYIVFKVNNTMYMHNFYSFVQLYDRSKFATEKKVNLKFNSCIDFIIRSIVI